jgi:hypothetical protein
MKKDRVEYTYGPMPEEPRPLLAVLVGRLKASHLWPVASFLLAGVLTALSYRFGWPPVVENAFMLFMLLIGAGIAAWFAIRSFLESTRGKPGARKRGVAEFLGIPDESEPEPSRRLWQWQCTLYALLVPGAYFFLSFPALSFASFAALGIGRVLIARRRREHGGSPQRLTMMPMLFYLGFLLMTCASTVLHLV